MRDWRLDAATAGRACLDREPLAAGARADDASDDDGGDSDEDSLPDPDLVVASEDDE